MEQTKYDVFISYRREGGAQYARTIQQALEKHYHVFLDFDELKDGVFNQRIIDAISESPVFLLILSKGALDRCVNETDWMRLEILHAMKCGCHIVPVTIVDDKFEGFPSDFPEELQRAVGCHQFSELQMKTLFKASMEQLIKERIAPYVHSIKAKPESGKEEELKQEEVLRHETSQKYHRADNENLTRELTQKKELANNTISYWWKEYNMEPVGLVMSKFVFRLNIAILISFLIPIVFGVGFINNVYKSGWEDDDFLGLGLIILYCWLPLWPLLYKKKVIKNLHMIDCIEKPSFGVKYRFVISGTSYSHKFGLFSSNMDKIIVLPIYDSLKWREDGKFLDAVLDGVPMIVDINGNEYK